MKDILAFTQYKCNNDYNLFFGVWFSYLMVIYVQLEVTDTSVALFVMLMGRNYQQDLEMAVWNNTLSLISYS